MHDTEWLGLTRTGDDRWSFELTPPLSRFDGKFYGGTGIAVATALVEAQTERHALWCTVQFVASTTIGQHIDCQVEVLAAGRRTSQVRITAHTDDGLLFNALASAGADQPNVLSAQFGRMPEVDPPDVTAPWRPNVPFPIDMDAPSWLSISQIREARADGTRHVIWARMKDQPLSRAALGFLADMTPSAVVRAAGRAGAGTSLDNSMRFGAEPTGEWLLVDFDPYLAEGGYAHGGARLWSEDGRLLGVASQTAALLLFD